MSRKYALLLVTAQLHIGSKRADWRGTSTHLPMVALPDDAMTNDDADCRRTFVPHDSDACPCTMTVVHAPTHSDAATTSVASVISTTTPPAWTALATDGDALPAPTFTFVEKPPLASTSTRPPNVAFVPLASSSGWDVVKRIVAYGTVSGPVSATPPATLPTPPPPQAPATQVSSISG